MTLRSERLHLYWRMAGSDRRRIMHSVECPVPPCRGSGLVDTSPLGLRKDYLWRRLPGGRKGRGSLILTPGFAAKARAMVEEMKLVAQGMGYYKGGKHLAVGLVADELGVSQRTVWRALKW